MKIFVIDADADAWGPYSEEMAAKILPICQAVHPDAEIVAKDVDEHAEQLQAGLLPYQIRVDIVDGEPQLPATVSLTWPPEKEEWYRSHVGQIVNISIPTESKI